MKPKFNLMKSQLNVTKSNIPKANSVLPKVNSVLPKANSVLPNASSEQIEIIEQLKTNNVIVDAVAGSGKTTSIMHVAKHFPCNILLLTYNKRLKFETRAKAENLNIKNIETHSYHSFCVKYYDGSCHKDTGIQVVIETNKHSRRTFSYDMIIIDEVQDMSQIYFELVHKIISDNSSKIFPKLCLLGDKNQCIFKFNGADERFIVYADKLLNVNGFSWKQVALSTTFRLTTPNAEFLNKVVLKNDRLHAIKHADKNSVRYIICDAFSDENHEDKENQRTYDEVVYYLKNYRAEDIFILAPSVKSDATPVRQLANLLSKNNVPIFVPTSDEELIDDDILKGKIAFCTFHQAKGLERKVVIVFNFDNTYFKYYNKYVNTMICPNELYVALTRSSEKMTIIHHYTNNFLPFLNKEILKDYCLFEENKKLRADKSDNDSNSSDQRQITVAATELTRHLPSDVIDEAMKYIQVSVINGKEQYIDIPLKTKQGNFYENVSEITGTAIPAYCELHAKGSCKILDVIKRKCLNISNVNAAGMNIKQYDIESIDVETITVDEMLYIANRYCAFTSGYIFKPLQVINYNWLSVKNLDICMQRLNAFLTKDAVFEVEALVEKKEELISGNRSLKGFIDCVDGTNVYEFKCVSELQNEHFLQLAIYKYMYETNLKDNISQQIETLIGPPDQIYIYDEVCYSMHNVINTGIVNAVFKNGKIKVGKTHILPSSIIKNNTYERKYLNLQNDIIAITRNYYLFNILSNEKYEIKANLDDLCKMIEYLVRCKYYPKDSVSDEEFIRIALDFVNKKKNSWIKQNVDDISIGKENGTEDKPIVQLNANSKIQVIHNLVKTLVNEKSYVATLPMNINNKEWLDVKNNNPATNPKNIGKWMLFFGKHEMNEKWLLATELFKQNILKDVISICCTTNANRYFTDSGAIFLQCVNSQDESYIKEIGKNILDAFDLLDVKSINYKSNDKIFVYSLDNHLRKSDRAKKLNHLMCNEDGCTTRPSYNIPGEEHGLYCVRHKKAEHVNVKFRQRKNAREAQEIKDAQVEQETVNMSIKSVLFNTASK